MLRSPRRHQTGRSTVSPRRQQGRLTQADGTPRPQVAPHDSPTHRNLSSTTTSTTTRPSEGRTRTGGAPLNAIPLGASVIGRGAAASSKGGFRADKSEPGKLSGHAEYVMEVCREFFSKHSLNAMLEVFRNHDFDKSGTLEYPEFRAAMQQVNLDLTEKDMSALFHAADFDDSGTIEFAEMLNRFRKDGTGLGERRETFFFSKERPRELLGRAERNKLANSLKGGVPSSMRSKEDIMAIIQNKVDQGVTPREVRCAPR